MREVNFERRVLEFMNLCGLWDLWFYFLCVWVHAGSNTCSGKHAYKPIIDDVFAKRKHRRNGDSGGGEESGVGEFCIGIFVTHEQR